MKKLSFAVTTLLFFSQISFAESKPKLGPKDAPRAVPLSASNEFFRSSSNPAPDYWALAGHYVPQFNGYSCSAASVTMVLNAARAAQPKTTEDKLVLQEELLNKVKAEKWKQRLSKEGVKGDHGTTLDTLGKVAKASFEAYGFKNVLVDVVHLNETSAKTRDALIDALEKNEKSTKDWIIANFNQQAFTDDSDAGHIAPVGAYDAKNKMVLIMDPDREYYEPYWISLDTFMAGMATKDSSSKANRGYLVIRTEN